MWWAQTVHARMLVRRLLSEVLVCSGIGRVRVRLGQAWLRMPVSMARGMLA